MGAVKRRDPDATPVSRRGCKHQHCGDCATRRGAKRGVRRERHSIRTLLRGLL
jgi:hypothetical protein